MSSIHWTDRLSDYLDGELADGEQASLEAHLAECEACMGTLAELRGVVRGAGELPPIAPSRDLWPSIHPRLSARGAQPAAAEAPEGRPVAIDIDRRRSVVMSVPQLAAAAIALIVFSASGVWLAVRGPGAEPALAISPAATAPGADGTGASVIPVLHGEPYERAVAELEGAFEQRREALDPATILVVERNLAIIDAAIAEARAALAADPTSGFLNSYIASTMQRKVDLLRQAARLERAES